MYEREDSQFLKDICKIFVDNEKFRRLIHEIDELCAICRKKNKDVFELLQL